MDDAPALAVLGARTFRDTYSADNDPEDMRQYIAEAFTPEQIGIELADEGAAFLVAELYGNPIGYALLRAGDAPECVTDPNPIELVRIYMDQGTIGHGYGSELMRACLAQARDAGHAAVWLGVWENNEAGQSFYRKWGFDAVGTKEFVVGDDAQTDIVMVRSTAG